MPSVVRRTITICLSSLIIGSVTALNAVAAEPVPTKPLTLRELLETLNNRPLAPAAAAPAEPIFTAPDAAPETGAASDQLVPDQPATSTVRLQLDLSDRKVYVYRGDTLEVSYPVAIGRPGWETPTGEFEIFSQVVDPGWTNPLTDEVMAPGPDNPLGDRWIAFWTDGVNSIGFHGTPNRDSVGQAASHGCIRMYNEDVRALYDMVALGTPVVVQP